MKNVLRLLALVFGVCLTANAAHADMMPDEYLQKDYDNCMGGSSAQQDPQRAQYCQCVRNGMRQWTTDQYGALATEAKDSKAPPAELDTLAKTCIAQVLH